MSSARKRAAIRKAEEAAAHERSQKLLAQHHADVMQGICLVAAQKHEAQSALMKEMAEALEAMLSALNNEASAAMAAEVASSNFDNPEPYIANYEKAVIASSEASTKANAALAKYKEQS